jgi:dihydrofolate reductase
MYMTRIEHEFAADTFFSDYQADDWQLLSSEKGITNEKNPYTYSFLVYDRRA